MKTRFEPAKNRPSQKEIHLKNAIEKLKMEIINMELLKMKNAIISNNSSQNVSRPRTRFGNENNMPPLTLTLV